MKVTESILYIFIGLLISYFMFTAGAVAEHAKEHLNCLEIVGDKEKCNQIFGE
ncbi:MAG: hypothetical protein RI930_61 [Pseudomonadota bacterium]|jgi:hypothetical protein